jgi:dihydrofolate reductase
VVSRNAALALPDGVFCAASLDAALDIGRQGGGAAVENIFVIGGAELYQIALGHKACQRIFVTQIDQTFDCDAFFPRKLNAFEKVEESLPAFENSLQFVFQTYRRR